MRIVPLDDRHDRAAFHCGVEPLDRYLRTRAGQDMRKRVSSCFVALVDDGPAIAGYYTLSATSILLSDLPQDIAKRLPRYPAMPAALMGRLAVDRRQHGKRFGEMLLLDAMHRVLASDIAMYAFVVDAKNEQAEAFYGRYGFRRLSSAANRFYLPVAEIVKLFAG